MVSLKDGIEITHKLQDITKSNITEKLSHCQSKLLLEKY